MTIDASASSGPIRGRLPQDLVGTSVSAFLHPEDLAGPSGTDVGVRRTC